MLWRIDPLPNPHDQQLGQKLLLHLRYARLSTLLVQIESRQQCYLITEGCVDCRHQRCQPGCRAALLRRIVQSNGADMQPVLQGLAARPYSRLLLALPTAQARIPDLEDLAAWPELRMQLTWAWHANKLRLTLLLAHADAKNSACALLRSLGWQTVQLPGLLAQRYASMPFPGHIPLPGRATLCEMGLTPAHGPSLRLPAASESSGNLLRAERQQEQAEQSLAAMTMTDFSAAYERLLSIERCEQQNRPASETSPVAETMVVHALGRQTETQPSSMIDPDQRIVPAEAHDPEPTSPTASNSLPFPIQQLEEWLGILSSEATLHEGRPGRVGLAASRLVWALGVPLRTARMLMVWLDDANLLARPLNAAQAWSGPRPLTTRDTGCLLQGLLATAAPDESRVQMAYSRDRGGS